MSEGKQGVERPELPGADAGAPAPRSPEVLKARFGDIIENGWASESNPTRVGFFVREGRRAGRMNPGRYFEVTDGAGTFWNLPVDRDHKITVRPASHAPQQAETPELARCLRNMISALDAARSDMAELFARKIEATREAACAALAAVAPDDASLGRHTGSEALGTPQSPPSQPEEGQ